MRRVIYARLFVLVSTCLAFSFQASEADDKITAQEFSGVISGDRVNVRASDATSSEVICQFAKGEKAVICGKKGKWYMVELPSRAPVYVSKSGVAKSNGTGTVSEDKLLVRTAATKSSSVVGRLGKGATVRIRKEYLDWYEIDAPKGSYGWVHSDYVSRDGEQYVKKDAALAQGLAALDTAYRDELKKPLREIELNWILEGYRKYAAENKDTSQGQQAALKAEEIKLKIAEIEHIKAKEEYDAKIKNISSPRPGEAPLASGIVSNVGKISGRLSKYKLMKDGKQIGYVASSKEDLGKYVNLPVNIWGARKEVKGTVLFEADAVQIIE